VTDCSEANSFLDESDNAEIPECCHPGEKCRTVQYTFKLPCVDPCPEDEVAALPTTDSKPVGSNRNLKEKEINKDEGKEKNMSKQMIISVSLKIIPAVLIMIRFMFVTIQPVMDTKPFVYLKRILTPCVSILKIIVVLVLVDMLILSEKKKYNSNVLKHEMKGSDNFIRQYIHIKLKSY